MTFCKFTKSLSREIFLLSTSGFIHINPRAKGLSLGNDAKKFHINKINYSYTSVWLFAIHSKATSSISGSKAGRSPAQIENGGQSHQFLPRNQLLSYQYGHMSPRCQCILGIQYKCSWQYPTYNSCPYLQGWCEAPQLLLKSFDNQLSETESTPDIGSF